MNENVSKIIINDRPTINLLFLNCSQHFGNFKHVALEVGSPGNQHRVNCIGTLSFPIYTSNLRLLCMLSTAMARSSSGGVAIRYVLPVLRMTSYLPSSPRK